MENIKNDEDARSGDNPANKNLEQSVMFQTDPCPANQQGKDCHRSSQQWRRQEENSGASCHAYGVQAQLGKAVIDCERDDGREN